MRRLFTLIAVLFAFAAVAGATTAHAHRYISTPMAVLNLVDENNQSIPVIVHVQRGEIDLGSGIMMPCGAHPGIPVAVAQMPVCPTAGGVKPGLDETAADWVGTSPLRPPKHV